MASPLLAIIFACSENPPPVAPNEATGPTTLTASADEGADVQLDVPLNGLTQAQLARFNQGRDVFTRVFTDATGLGPSFNAVGCANCHEEPSVGGVGDDLAEDIETHVSSPATESACSDLAAQGGGVIQHHTTASLQTYYPTYTEEAIPAGASVGHRSTPMVFGFGLLDAIPDAAILANADPNDANHDGVSGRAHMVGGRVARFGRKATDVTLLGFNAGAFLMEVGVVSNLASPTSAEQLLLNVPSDPYDITIDPLIGAEISDADLTLANDFVRFLRPPPKAKATVQTNDGKQLFSTIGCATCHVPSFKTGPSSVNALSNVTVEPFTDLLLHDMGPGLADICRGDAKPEEFRTEPLMGLRFRQRFLHDARATTLTDAITAHGGEGANSVTRFNALTANQKAALIAYLQTL